MSVHNVPFAALRPSRKLLIYSGKLNMFREVHHQTLQPEHYEQIRILKKFRLYEPDTRLHRQILFNIQKIIIKNNC